MAKGIISGILKKKKEEMKKNAGKGIKSAIEDKVKSVGNAIKGKMAEMKKAGEAMQKRKKAKKK